MERELDWLLREKYNGKETVAFLRDAKRLGKGEHIAYVIGFSNFLGVKVDLSARPLIPRPETEYWVESFLSSSGLTRGSRSLDSRFRGNDNQKIQILDAFCGSGCIGLAVLKKVPRAQVDFADIEKKYFAGIKKSLRSNKIRSSRARFFRSDVLKNLRVKKYDYILANPPYIPTRGRRVEKSVLSQEPRAALFAGADGLKFIRALLGSARKYLAPGGELVFEFDPPQRKQIGALARRFGYEVQFFKDQHNRYRYAVLSSKK